MLEREVEGLREYLFYYPLPHELLAVFVVLFDDLEYSQVVEYTECMQLADLLEEGRTLFRRARGGARAIVQ